KLFLTFLFCAPLIGVNTLFTLSRIKKKNTTIKTEEVDRFTERFLKSIQNQELINLPIVELDEPDIIDFDESLLEEL
ncbi:MAG: hypothetical protein WCL03_14005, partial [Bacteroidota bacterium]